MTDTGFVELVLKPSKTEDPGPKEAVKIIGMGGILRSPHNLWRELVTGDCNAPNALFVPFHLELSRNGVEN